MSLCRRYMSAVSRLQPGCGPWLGPVARELATSLTRLLEADLGNNNLGLGQRETVARMKEVIQLTRREARARHILRRQL